MGVGIQTNEIVKEFFGWFRIAFAQNAFAEGETRFGVHDSLLLKAGKRIRIQNFGPFVGIIRACISHWIAEEMPELPGNGRWSGFEVGPVFFDERLKLFLQIAVSFDNQFSVEQLIHLAEA